MSVALTSTSTTSKLTANGVDVISTDATGEVSAKINGTLQPIATAIPALSQALGVGQTWQNVTGSRSAGTTYTNSTGRSIFIMIRAQNNGVGTWYLNGSAMWSSGSTEFLTVSTILKAGDTYSFSVAFSIWMELR